MHGMQTGQRMQKTQFFLKNARLQKMQKNQKMERMQKC